MNVHVAYFTLIVTTQETFEYECTTLFVLNSSVHTW